MSINSNLLQESPPADSMSLADQFTSLEWIEATRDAALQLWRASVLSMIESIPTAPKQICEPHRRGLKQLVDEMPNQPTPNQLDQCRAKTAEILKSYGTQMGTFIDSQEREAKAILTSAAQITETLLGLDQRYAVRLQGITRKLRLLASSGDLADMHARLNTEVAQFEKCVEEQERDTRSAMSRLNEDINTSELRRQRGLPGTGSEHASNSLLALDRAISGWDHYCLVRYDFKDRNGNAPDAGAWKSLEAGLQGAFPERVGHPVRVVVLKSGTLLAAVQCQLLEYAGQADSMERSLAQASGLACKSRVVEPLPDEAMREAMARLEKAA